MSCWGFGQREASVQRLQLLDLLLCHAYKQLHNHMYHNICCMWWRCGQKFWLFNTVQKVTPLGWHGAASRCECTISIPRPMLQATSKICFSFFCRRRPEALRFHVVPICASVCLCVRFQCFVATIEGIPTKVGAIMDLCKDEVIKFGVPKVKGHVTFDCR